MLVVLLLVLVLVVVLVGGESKAFFIVFAIWEPFMAQSQDRVDGVCDWS